jgi:hypothetical protein
MQFSNHDFFSVLKKSMPWGSIPKVVGSIPTVAGHIFQARPMWIYTQSNITNIMFKAFLFTFLFAILFV